MKVYSISDLHLSAAQPKPMDIFGGAWDNYVQDIICDWTSRVTSADVVLIPGDISWAMTLDNALLDLNLIGSLPGKKIILRGNHDYWWKSISALRAALPPEMFAVQNDCLRIENLLVCGSRGWTTSEGKVVTADDKKIYDREVIRMNLSLSDMASRRRDGDKVIALIHYPPFNSRFESTPFTDSFENFKADAVVYGHLHGSASKTILNLNKNGINYFLTSCDLVKNKLVEILEI